MITTLDAQTRPLQKQVAGLTPINYAYDTRGRLTTISQGSGTATRTQTFVYNTLNQLTSITDPLSRSVNFSYDLAGRVTSQTLPDGRVINYSYDQNGNVTSITPPSRPAHNFGYTVTDLEQNYTPPLLGTLTTATNYSYNLDKQLIQIVRPDGINVNFNYDAGGRLANLMLPQGQITYAYNTTTGNLSTITAPGGESLSYTYDGALVTSSAWSGTVNGRISRTYDNNFRIISDSVNGAQTMTYGYDNDGLLTSAGSLAINRNLQNGLITGTTLGSLADSYTYSVYGEMTGYQASFGTTQLKNLQYTRDNLGRITQKVEDGNTYSYSYDLAGRLTDVTLNSVNQAHYTYDGNSNRLSLTTPGGTTSGAYDAQDRLISYGTNSYTYTNNGELLTKTNGSGTTTYTYDTLGNLLSITLPNGTRVDYILDGQNRRIGKKINGALLEGYLYSDQLRIAATLDMNNAIISRFIYGSKINVPDYMIKGGSTYRIISDHLGSPRLVVNLTDGTIAEAMNYDEFGNITSDTNPGFIPFGFAGGLYDPFTKLTRFGTRDYDAETGKWMNKDILGLESGVNLYEYVGGDPINWYDPFGLDRLINPLPGGPFGPRITFNNDTPGGPSTNLPVTEATADMIENAVRNSGLDININSTRGGTHDPRSNHPKGRAVDINRVGGADVNENNLCAKVLQDAFADEENIRENFGPFSNEKTLGNGDIILKPDMASQHSNHIHVSGQR